jgi:hypothetical protein
MDISTNVRNCDVNDWKAKKDEAALKGLALFDGPCDVRRCHKHSVSRQAGNLLTGWKTFSSSRESVLLGIR